MVSIWLCMGHCIATRLPEPSSDKDDMIRHPCRCGSELGVCLALTHADGYSVLVYTYRRDHSSAVYPAQLHQAGLGLST
jgi:hypothetical protein